MNKTIIISNRLPLDLNLKDNELEIKSSIGGLATGMKSIHAEGNSIWIGWSGLTEEQLIDGLADKVQKALEKEKCVTVPLNKKDVKNFYYGFSNKALWPLFHYFMVYAEFELDQWESYKEVNQKFADVVLEHANDGDTIWIHDYQLLLLPKMIKDKKPNLSIGFFLHIPYPSYEIFRTFPWRKELLTGMLGADLIGFHTYDYVRHFLSSVTRILGLEIKFNEILFQDRIIKVDSFPMGIDYNRYHNAALEHQKRKTKEKSEIMLKLEEYKLAYPDSKLILSIDRMDYTKGIPNRIKAFEYFLTKYPEYKEKVILLMLAVPSRSNVQQYQKLKRQTDELVGQINGSYATVNWTPIWYFYRSMPFDDLIDLYTSSQVALITPIRDGMNLVAKEYVATRVNQDGVLILSEMTGAAKEMYEALLINPNNFDQTADAIKHALEMPAEEQKSRINVLQERLSRYNVEKWADEFIKSLEATKTIIDVSISKRINENVQNQIISNFKKAHKKLLLLDYDGTLVGFNNSPKDSFPDAELFQILDKLLENENTDIVVISGRDRATLGDWFAHKEYTLITDHGVWLKSKGKEWEALENLKNEWKLNVLPIMESFVNRTPGAFIEEKEYSLAWHYRKADPELAKIRNMELKLVLTSLISNNGLAVLEGSKVLEIKSSSVNKGRAAAKLLIGNKYDFIFAIGDDRTDEYMFEELPEEAFTVKVGTDKTHAKYYVKNTDEVRALLTIFNTH